MSLFDMTETTTSATSEVPNLPEWPKEQRLADEKEFTGAYFTGHPLDAMRGIIDDPRYVAIGTLPDLTREEIDHVRDMAGMLRGVTFKMTKKEPPTKFAVITVEDFTGSTEALVWGDAFKKAMDQEGLLQVGSFVRFRARISEDDRTGGKKVSVNSMEPLPTARRNGAQGGRHYEVTLNTARHDADDLKLVAEILQRHPGKVPVYVNFRNSLGNRACIELGERFCVTPSEKLDEELSLYS